MIYETTYWNTHTNHFSTSTLTSLLVSKSKVKKMRKCLTESILKVVLFFTSLIYFLRPRFIEPPTKPLFTPFTFYKLNLLGQGKRNASLLTQGLSHFQTSLCCNSSIFFLRTLHSQKPSCLSFEARQLLKQQFKLFPHASPVMTSHPKSP